MKTVREMLTRLDVELEEYQLLVYRARNPALSCDDRNKLIRASGDVWKRLEAAHREIASAPLKPSNANERGQLLGSMAASGLGTPALTSH